MARRGWEGWTKPLVPTAHQRDRSRGRHMAILGTLLKHVRAGEARLAWNLPALAGPETIDLHSADFRHDGTMPVSHTGRRVGGQNLSPSLAWTGVPLDCAQLLLVVQDVDTPTRSPFVHCVALMSPELDT